MNHPFGAAAENMTRFRASIEKHRLREIDFRIQVGALQKQENDRNAGTVTVTCTRTGIARSYCTGRVHADWPYIFSLDLGRCVFD